MKTILCPTDLSAASETALRWATAIAARTGTGITALHALDGDGGPGAARDEVKAKLAAAAQAIVGEVPMEVALPAGEPQAVIVDAARQDHGLMVAGTHGPKGLRQRLFGADMLKLVRQVSVPSLVLQAASPADPRIRRILLPVAGHQDISALLGMVCLLARAFDAEVHVFQVDRPGEEPSAQLLHNKRTMLDRFAAEGIPHQDVVVPSTVFSAGFAEQTIRHAQATGMDLIAIMASASDEYRWIADAEKERLLANAARVPVLCAP
ncbi:MAG: universal stress protein [Flavobacteriales bacterium]|jgi:nucleotide-binding universal stress UspA family protein|nr:universal stress protein [Flavobacteriales bacterium]